MNFPAATHMGSISGPLNTSNNNTYACIYTQVIMIETPNYHDILA